MLKVKKGVVFKVFEKPIIDLINYLWVQSEKVPFYEKYIMITSANDGKHSEKSLHYKNLAIDLRIKNLTKDETHILLKRLRNWDYKNEYDFVLEKDHIHCEYDPK